jgi:5-formyltetrahydrofolate cyclo-ligase
MSLKPTEIDPASTESIDGGAQGHIDQRKQLARTAARSARRALSLEDRSAKAQLIRSHIVSSKAWAESNLVLTYFAAGSEVDLSGLLQMSVSPGPSTFGAPIVEGENMRFGCVRRGGDGSPQTTVGPYGLQEPDGPPVELEHVGLVLVPLLAFDLEGNRLGSGKGFYDRFFAANPVLKQRTEIMGVAFEAQRVEDLPTEPHDYRLDAVVTEAGITTFR